MIAPPLLDAIIARALEEDVAGGDLTTEACVDPSARAVGEAVARKPLVVCGGAVFARVFAAIDAAVRFEPLVADGTAVEVGAVIWRERYAVRCGGAHNHRDDLGSAVLIKDNHIVAAGGIATAVSRARQRAPHTSRVELEVASLPQLDEAIAAGADVIMLDNFSMDDVREAVARVARLRPRPLLEVSGGITLERIAELGAAGVDVISAGALTHSAPAADIALDLHLEDPERA